ncbi:MAG TPA: glycosyltransferase family 2 protein [bacterium]|nr:glycosyltransferase family 2 protein [bacterium]HPN29688.1 glycosyltransferase family 2 protein [bacterium]
MKSTLLIPVLNEAEGMKQIMPKINRNWFDQILIVDGGSKDGTLEYAEQNGYQIIRQKKKGIRYAYIEAMEHITGDVVVTFSPDGNSIPELLPELLNKMSEGFDMVIVSRYLDGAKSEDDDLFTGFGNWLFTTLINKVHSAKYTDAMVIYRAWKKELFYKLNLHLDSSYQPEEKLFFTRVGVEPLLSIRAAKYKCNFREIPGDEPPRIGGERKLRVIQWGLAYMFEVFKEKIIK